MAQWNKILVSGSNIEVNDIIASGNVTFTNPIVNNTNGNILILSGSQNIISSVTPENFANNLVSNVSSFTQGSIIFADSDGSLTEDNSQLYWDNINNRLGIGTNNPTFPLQIQTGGRALAISNYITTQNIPDSILAGWDVSAVYLGYDYGSYQIHIGSLNTGDVRIRTFGNTIVEHGKLGVSTLSPTEKLDINNGNAKINGKIYFTDIADIKTIELNPDGDSYINGGNVGIGISSPTEKLDVDGNIKLNGSMTIFDGNQLNLNSTGNVYSGYIKKNGYDGEISLGQSIDIIANRSLRLSDNNGNRRWIFGTVIADTTINDIFSSFSNSNIYAGHNGYFGFYTYGSIVPTNVLGLFNRLDNNNNGVKLLYKSASIEYEGLVINNVGKVGIGTTTPTEKLDVNGNIKADGTLKLFDVTDTQKIELNPNGDSYILNGNLGIGTTSPSARLHVSSSTGDSVIRMSSPAANTLAFNHYSSYSTLRDLTLNSNRILFFDTGKNNIPGFLGVGISGAEQPSTQLDVRSSTANTYPVKVQGANSNDIVKFYDSTVGGEMYMQDSTGTVDVKISTGASSYFNGGNVGIGTTSPTERLDVVGNIKYNGSINNGVTFKKSFYLANILSNSYKAVGQLNFLNPFTHHFRVTVSSYSGFKVFDFHGYLENLHKQSSGWYEQSQYPNVDVIIEPLREIVGNNHITGVKIGIKNNDGSYHDYIYTVTVECLSAVSSWIDFDENEPIVETSITLNDRQDVGGEALYINHTNKRLGVNRPTPTEILDVDGNIKADGILKLYDITNTQKIEFNPDGDSYINSGNVGIGTTTPSEKLDVNGAIKAVNFIGNTAVPIQLIVDNGNLSDSSEIRTGLGEFKIYSGRSGGIHQKFVFSTGDNYTSGATRMTISSNGNVGINTTLPVEKLDVDGNIKADGILKLYDITNTQKISLNPDGDSYINGKLAVGKTTNISYPFEVQDNDTNISTTKQTLARFYRNDGTYNPRLEIRTSTDGIDIYQAYTTLARNLTISNPSGEVLRINSNGNVGIGTTNSGTKLYISGDPALNAIGTQSLLRLERPFNAGVSFAQGADIAIGRGNTYPSTQMRFILDNGTNNPTNPQTTIMTLDSSGNVGIGTTSPARRLHISKTDGDNELVTLRIDNNLGYSEFGTQSNYARILSNGDLLYAGNLSATFFYLGNETIQTFKFFNSKGHVGIRNSNPTEILDVNGNIKADGTLKLFDLTDTQTIELNPDGDSYINSGNLGIGTTTPSQKLDIIGAIRMSNTNSDLTIKTSYSLLRHYDNSKNDISVYTSASNSGGNSITIGGGSTLFNSATSISFNTATNNNTINGSTRMLINYIGNVGVGTNSPTEKLDVVGNIKSSGYITGKRCGAAGYLAAPVNITVTTANTYYPIGVFTVPVAADFIVGTTYPNGLKYTGTIAQTFHITWNATIESTSNNVSSIIDIEKNGVSIPMAKMGTYSKTGGEIYNLNGQCVVDLDVNDEVRFVVTADNNGEVLTFDYFAASIKEFFD